MHEVGVSITVHFALVFKIFKNYIYVFKNI
jgi:hypothetical protein